MIAASVTVDYLLLRIASYCTKQTGDIKWSKR